MSSVPTKPATNSHGGHVVRCNPTLGANDTCDTNSAHDRPHCAAYTGDNSSTLGGESGRMSGASFAASSSCMGKAIWVALFMYGCNANFGTFTNGPDAATHVGALGHDAGECIQNWYADEDGDQFGDPQTAIQACSAPPGFVANDLDCDDEQPLVHPNAAELCGDKIDNDCRDGDLCATHLVGHWLGSAPEATTAPDDGSARNPGDLKNGPVWNETEAAMTFDGTDDYVEIPHAAGYALSAGTVSVWFRTMRVAEQGIWSKDAVNYRDGGDLSLYVSDHVVRGRLQSDAKSFNLLSQSLEANVWHHAVMTFGATDLTLYVDGQPAASANFTGGIAVNTQPIVVGQSSHLSTPGNATPISWPFAGHIADVRLYNRALSEVEVNELYATTQRSRP